jgi:hypothetical protein
MRNKTLLTIGIGLVSAAGLSAQSVAPVPAQGIATLDQLGVNLRPAIAREGFGQVVTGSPFSAREERKTVQTLADGTVIESSDTSMLYRDAQGRTRIEQTMQGRTRVSISDPVAGVRLQVDPQERTVMRMTMPAGAGGRGIGQAAVPARLTAGYTGDGTKAEDLGQSMQNGVMAQGTRTTVTIPQGQIGNSRDLRVVNERWYSKELQMAVKTVNSDPRFGTTTYELTNISRAAPDPMLFQAPVEYTVTEPGGRGRGVGVGIGIGEGGARGGR